MRPIIVPALLAVALALGGSVFWTIGKAEQRLADAHRDLAMLQYADASAESDATAAVRPIAQRVAGIGGAAQMDARELHATADYWQARYPDLEPKRDAGGSVTETDPEVLFLAANAAFRASQTDADRNTALRKLDATVKSYADVLKTAAAPVDAAYNYEYSIRVRDALAKRSPAQAKAAAARAAADADTDLPAGPTLHGRPGGPPAKSDMAQFKIVIPKRGEERKDDPQAGKGNVKVRKG
ncbi:MAG TPA: hypothetical protein VGY48_21585 [Vicinamibacterales bacterium]|jgi:hypothetical protein|nr:hypothetical protein [Vicinamibacterales bacterium]